MDCVSPSYNGTLGSFAENGCLYKIPGECVFYTGPNVTDFDIINGDTFNTVVQKITNFLDGVEVVEGVPPITIINGVLSMPRADSDTSGYLHYDDFNLFYNRVPPTRNINTLAPLFGGGPLHIDRTFGITQAGVGSDGYVSAEDWLYFSQKVEGASNLEGIGGQVFKQENGGNVLEFRVLKAGTGINLITDDTSITIDCTITGGGEGADGNNYVTSISMVNTLFTLNRDGLTPLTVTIDNAAVGLGNVQNVDTTNASNITSGTLPSGRFGPLTGDVTTVGYAATIANDAVTLAKMANMPSERIIGRNDVGTGDPEYLTGTEVTALLDLFSTSTKGLVPSGGTATTVLAGNGTWITALLAANNGLSLSGTTAQLGGPLGSASAATLQNHREVPMDSKQMTWSNGFTRIVNTLGTLADYPLLVWNASPGAFRVAKFQADICQVELHSNATSNGYASLLFYQQGVGRMGLGYDQPFNHGFLSTHNMQHFRVEGHGEMMGGWWPLARNWFFGLPPGTLLSGPIDNGNKVQIYDGNLWVEFNAMFASANTTATAKVHIGPVNNNAGTAPLKFEVGSNLMTLPEDGAFEYTNTSLYFTKGSTRYDLLAAALGGDTNFANMDLSLIGTRTHNIGEYDLDFVSTTSTDYPNSVTGFADDTFLSYKEHTGGKTSTIENKAGGTDVDTYVSLIADGTGLSSVKLQGDGLIQVTGTMRLNTYTSPVVGGTLTYMLGVDENGNVITTAPGGGGGGGEDFNDTLAIGDFAINKEMDFSSTTELSWASFAKWTPSNEGVVYSGGTYGKGGAFYMGWTRTEGVNATSLRPNVVADVFTYNMKGGAPVISGEAGARFAFETNFDLGSGHSFEVHWPEISKQGGGTLRPASYYINKVTGETALNYLATGSVTYQTVAGLPIYGFNANGNFTHHGYGGSVVSTWYNGSTSDEAYQLQVTDTTVFHNSFGLRQDFDTGIHVTGNGSYPVDIEVTSAGGWRGVYLSGANHTTNVIPFDAQLSSDTSVLLNVTNTNSSSTTAQAEINLGNGTNSGLIFYAGTANTGWGNSAMGIINNNGSLRVYANATNPVIVYGSQMYMNDTVINMNNAYTIPKTAGAPLQVLRMPASGTTLEWYTPSAGTTVTASNGLNKDVNDIQLGGALTEPTTITSTATNYLTITGAIAVSGSPLVVSNTGTGHGINAVGGGSGYGVIASGFKGLHGTGTNAGVHGISTTGVGIWGVVDNGGQSGRFDQNVPSGSNGLTTTLVKLNKFVTGGVGANGIGVAIEFAAATTASGSAASTGGGINWQWENATDASRNGRFDFRLVNNGAAIANKLSILSTGKLIAHDYGDGNFTTGTATYALAVDASGNIMEVALGGGGGGSDTNFAEDDLTFTGSRTHEIGDNAFQFNAATSSNSTSSYLWYDRELFEVSNELDTGEWVLIYADNSATAGSRDAFLGVSGGAGFKAIGTGNAEIDGAIKFLDYTGSITGAANRLLGTTATGDVIELGGTSTFEADLELPGVSTNIFFMYDWLDYQWNTSFDTDRSSTIQLSAFDGFDAYNADSVTGDNVRVVADLGQGALLRAYDGTSGHRIDVVKGQIKLYSQGADGLIIVGDTGVTTNIVKLVNLPVHADEAAAVTAGLAQDTVYMTSTGELRIKL